MNWTLKQWCFYAVIILLPVTLRLFFYSVYHSFDVGTFENLIPYLSPFREVYLKECVYNYPIVGLFLSYGMMKLLFGSYFLYFAYLSLVESLNTLLFYKILTLLNVKKAKLISLIFMFLPSTWAGASIWGQIDHVGLTFILLLLIILLKLLNPVESKNYLLHIFIGFFIYLALFTKQILVLPLLPLGLFLLYRFSFKKGGLKNFIFQFLGFLIPFFSFELFLKLPADSTLTHYEHILKTGSSHINIVVQHGVSIWNFFFDNDLVSAHTRLFNFMSVKEIGLILSITFLMIITFLFFKVIKYLDTKKLQFGFLAFYVALCNLAVNLFLSGIHNRYLYYFYPFLLLAFCCLPQIFKSTFDRVLLVIGSISYGIFILSFPTKWLSGGELFFHEITIYHRALAGLHILIFFRLLWLFGNNLNLIKTENKLRNKKSGKTTVFPS